ncbi:MAG TPA: sigma-70 family RNA polymerase sigma factor [Chitinophagaceae bacterium]|jgi:RNA polymerase sigma-70 factor (ECF subfamily)|nr:sigma-70 family RNA polymerase sigma factor [Chitinophagaceae bacterium]
MSGPQLQQAVDHLFRHESGKMVAVLTRLLGLQHLEAAQDIVQDTLLQALHTWRFRGLPDNPPAWLHRVARNKAMDLLRREQTFRRKVHPEYQYRLQSEYSLGATVHGAFEEGAIEDSLLRMIFACCHPCIPVEAQLALALKTLCGLSNGEIARAFLTGEEAIAKRIYRARTAMREQGITLELPPPSEISRRLDAVLHCLYLLFNEGYHSAHPDRIIREDLCEEAMRLAYQLTKNERTDGPRTAALLALFCFQAARLPARLDDRGQIILLQHQDRSLWYRPLIAKGFSFLEGATGRETSVYHLEAAIAYFHASAPSFEATDWKAIYYLYSVLHTQRPTPFIALNKAIAALYAQGAATALAELREIRGLENHNLYLTALGDVYVQLQRRATAVDCYLQALGCTAAPAEKELLQRKLGACAE